MSVLLGVLLTINQKEVMTAQLYGPMPAPGGVGLPAWHSAAEWQAFTNSDRPVAYGDWYRFPLQADSTPDLKRRSEIKPGASQEAVEVANGMHTHLEGWVLPRLGAAGLQTRNWHCVAQLIGPNYDGQWVDGASVALMVRDGRWCIENGGLDWRVDLGPFVDGKALWCEIDVVLSERPELGEVQVKLGTMSGVINVRTFWHRYLIWSVGMYRGSGGSAYSPTYPNSDGSVGGPQPTFYQENNWKDIDIVNTWPAIPSPTYLM